MVISGLKSVTEYKRRPQWLIVEKANIFFTSLWKLATTAP